MVISFLNMSGDGIILLLSFLSILPIVCQVLKKFKTLNVTSFRGMNLSLQVRMGRRSHLICFIQ
jgi:hypothetical protein